MKECILICTFYNNVNYYKFCLFGLFLMIYKKIIELFYLTDTVQFIAYPITNKNPSFTGLCRFINFMVVQSNIFMENTLLF
jgi:hypothetical protein